MHQPLDPESNSIPIQNSGIGFTLGDENSRREFITGLMKVKRDFPSLRSIPGLSNIKLVDGSFLRTENV